MLSCEEGWVEVDVDVDVLLLLLVVLVVLKRWGATAEGAVIVDAIFFSFFSSSFLPFFRPIPISITILVLRGFFTVESVRKGAFPKLPKFPS